VPALSSSSMKTVSVTMPTLSNPDEIYDYEVKVMLWTSGDSQQQITEVMTYDIYGASGQY